MNSTHRMIRYLPVFALVFLILSISLELVVSVGITVPCCKTGIRGFSHHQTGGHDRRLFLAGSAGVLIAPISLILRRIRCLIVAVMVVRRVHGLLSGPVKQLLLAPRHQ